MSEPNDAKTAEKQTVALPEERVSTTQHEMKFRGKQVTYTATAGLMHVHNKDEKASAAVFYVAYVRDDISDTSLRPLTFCFNGGPGSSSVWLHLGAFGPQRIDMVDGVMPRPNSACMIDNECTLLDCTDLVFIDPVGTGFSRAGEEGKPEDFYGMDGDADCIAAFVQRYLSLNHRWASPKFLAGESYGTTRAGLLARKLADQGVLFNGLVMLSLAMDFQTFLFEPGNDLPYVLFLPTYAATAWHHGRLDKNIAPDLNSLLTEVREWAMASYAPALLRGSGLPEQKKREIAIQLARYTGLAVEDIESLNLRIADMRFSKSVLGRPGYTVGRMDGRYLGPDKDRDHRRTQRDPSIDAPMGPYTGIVNDHIRQTLQFEHDARYEILNLAANEAWNWTRKGILGYPNTADDLRQVMLTNPHMKVLFANGLYDLATPFFAAEYTADHLDLEPELRRNIRLTYYPAGHMMYFHRPSHTQLRADLGEFYCSALVRDGHE